jgi:hypothetical protein
MKRGLVCPPREQINTSEKGSALVSFLETKTNGNRIRSALTFLFLIAALGYPGNAVAEVIYLPSIIFEQGPPLRNGNFDQRPDGSWNESSTNNLPLIRTGESLAGVTPQSGEWAAWLGGADNEISTLAQFILIPEKATSLNFYIFLASYEGSGNCEKDFAFVRLGSNLLKTFHLCEATNTEEWIFEQIDISAFRGQSLNLSFQVVNDSSEWSNFFLDTVFISTE